MSNGCLLGVTWNKPIRASSPIPFKSKLLSLWDGFAIWRYFKARRLNASPESKRMLMREHIGCNLIPQCYPFKTCMSFLYLCSLHNILFYTVILYFFTFGIPVCNKQSERVLWTRPDAYFLLTFSLNNNIYIYCAIDFRLGLSWYMAQNSNTNNAPEHTSFSRAARPWAQMSLFKQRGAGRENKNCVGLKPYCKRGWN